MSSSQGGEEVPPLSSVDPNVYVLSEAIRSSMESLMEILATTMQKTALIMANTILEGFAPGHSLAEEPRNKRACASIEVAHGDSSGSTRKKNLGLRRQRLVLPTWWWLRQVDPRGMGVRMTIM